ncbi:hypothetical protein HRbin23_01491 [bacterium HR23]|nr:hypothetical protein HRbin23_01491 [bacterium HR23]
MCPQQEGICANHVGRVAKELPDVHRVAPQPRIARVQVLLQQKGAEGVNDAPARVLGDGVEAPSIILAPSGGGEVGDQHLPEVPLGEIRVPGNGQAHFRVLEAGEEGLRPPIVHPEGHQGDQAGAGVGVGVRIKGNGNAFGTGVVYQAQETACTPRHRGVEVGDVEGASAGPRDGDGLPEGVGKAVAQGIAHMGGVNAPLLGHHPAEGNEFLRIGIGAGGIGEAGREAERPLFHTLPQDVLLTAHLVGCRPPFLPPHRGDTQDRVAHQVADVDGCLPVITGQVVRHAGVAEVRRGTSIQTGVQVGEHLEVLGRGEGGVREAIHPHHLGGNALEHLGQVSGVPQDREG